MNLRPVAIVALAVCSSLQTVRAQDAAASTADNWRTDIGGGVRFGVPLATMGEYLGRAWGFGGTLRATKAGRPWRIAADAEFLGFANRTVTRPYQGTGPAIDITSSADVFLLGVGPELGFARGRWDLALQAAAGAAYIHSAARTSGLGISPQNERGNTYTTLTWQVQGGAALGCRLGVGVRSARLVLSGRLVHAGMTDFLREYNLPIGVISGLYANPTPYAPTFAVVALSVTAPL